MNPMRDQVAGLGVFTQAIGTTARTTALAVQPPGGFSGGSDGELPDYEHGQIAGLTINRGTPSKPRRPIVPEERLACGSQQCSCHVETAYFTRINLTAPTIAAGQSAAYGLMKLDVRQRFGQEARVLGVHFHLLPCDVNGTGLGTASATPLPWGDARGLSAALLVGVDLPTQLGAWSSLTAYAAGLELNQASPPASAAASIVTGARYLCSPIRFPTGTFDQVTPNFNSGTISFEGDQAPVLAGESLDVALVMDRVFVTGQTGQICGCAQLGIVIGHTINDRPFRL